MSEQRTITFEEAKALFDNYKENPANKGQTQQVYFKYDGLMDYLNSIGKKLGTDDTSNLGIKVYFGQYPDDHPDKEKQGRRTVFFVPCIAIEENGKIVDQDILTDDAKNRFGIDVEAYNHGQGCPPFNGTDQSGEPICTGSGF